MSAMIEVLVATEEHARELAGTMRAGDRAELATYDENPLGALLDGLRSSDAAFTLKIDGAVAAMFGVGKLKSGETRVGAAWCLTSETVNKHKRDYLRASRVCLAMLLEHYPKLLAAVDSRYRGALRWAEWLGFRLWDEVLLGPRQMGFRPITIGGQQWAQ